MLIYLYDLFSPDLPVTAVENPFLDDCNPFEEILVLVGLGRPFAVFFSINILYKATTLGYKKDSQLHLCVTGQIRLTFQSRAVFLNLFCPEKSVFVFLIS